MFHFVLSVHLVFSHCIIAGGSSKRSLPKMVHGVSDGCPVSCSVSVCVQTFLLFVVRFLLSLFSDDTCEEISVFKTFDI